MGDSPTQAKSRKSVFWDLKEKQLYMSFDISFPIHPLKFRNFLKKKFFHSPPPPPSPLKI